MRTFWFCEECSRTAFSNHKEHDDVMTVTSAIDFDHKRLSSGCENTIRNIRIINLPHILGKELPDYATDYLVDFLRERL